MRPLLVLVGLCSTPALAAAPRAPQVAPTPRTEADAPARDDDEDAPQRKPGVRKGAKAKGPKAGAPAGGGVKKPNGGAPTDDDGPRPRGPVRGPPLADDPDDEDDDAARPRGPVHGPPVAGGPSDDDGPRRPITGPRAGAPVGGAPAGGPPRPPVDGDLVRPGAPLVLPAVTPAHGVLLYGPRPMAHAHYDGEQDVAIRKKDLPERAVDRAGSLAVGLRGGGYWSSTPDATAVFADPGGGLLARYRPVEFLGLEGGFQHAVGAAGVDAGAPLRQHTLGTVSAQIFAFPWSRVSPFVSLGGTGQDSDLQLLGAADDVNSPTLWGAHGGLGVELAIGQSLAIDLDARYNHYVNAAAHEAVPAAVTTNLGLLFHF